VNETEQEKWRERENLNTHQRRDTSERLYIYTLANYDYDTRVCKRVPTTNERTSKRESPFFPFAETHALIAAILSAI